MGQKTAPETDLEKILYIQTSPYNPMAWNDALINCHQCSCFLKLMHDLTYGSPIGNLPPLTSMFLLWNLSSADLHPQLIDQELVTKVAAGHMSGLFTPDQAATIFGGFLVASSVACLLD